MRYVGICEINMFCVNVFVRIFFLFPFRDVKTLAPLMNKTREKYPSNVYLEY